MSSRQLQEYSLLFAIQAEERGELPPPEPDPADEDDEPDDDDVSDEDLAAMVEAERARIAALKETG